MSKLEKPVLDSGGRPPPEPDPMLLAASVLTLERSACATLAKVSATGAHLRGCGDVRLGDNLWIKVGVLDTLATVASRHGDLCGILFDVPLSEDDLRHFKAEAKNMLVMRMSAEEKAAAQEWIEGFAG